MKYICELCGTIYDEELGLSARKIAPGTAFEELGPEFVCPCCGSEKEAFTQVRPRQSACAGQDAAFWHGAKYADSSSESER